MQNFESVMSSSLQQHQHQQHQQQQQQQHQQSTVGSWYDMAIKSEPLDNPPNYSQQFQHLHLQDTPISHSSPTSPQSVDSMDSLGGRSQYYESKPPNGMMHGYTPLGFNPLTPPGYAGLFIPPQQQLPRQTTPNRSYSKQESGYVSSTLTPTHTPPMDVTPPKSPKDITETPEKEEDNLSDCGESYDGSEDEDGIRKPKINSHGKVKKFKCKQCDFVAVTKLSFWEHTRSHIKPEKMLNCPKCPFVTEYKHHLEYHLRNHQRSKPFKCPKCSYSCVNKSMLNSHMKSHSNVFQYRCSDCNYATKYCHSLKLHLRKYNHKPDVVLNLDGTPNPFPIIDVYGTRRGPKSKALKLAESGKAEPQQPSGQQSTQAPLTPQPHQPPPNHNPFTPPGGGQPTGLGRNLLPHQLLPNPLAHMFKSAASNNLPLFPYLNLNFQMFADQQAAIAQLSPNFRQQFNNHFQEKLNADEVEIIAKSNSNSSTGSLCSTSNSNSILGEELLKQITAAAADSSDLKPEHPTVEDNVDSADMDLQAAEDLSVLGEATSTPQTPSTSSGGTAATQPTNYSGASSKNRRKGRAFKLERLNEFARSLETGHTPMENSDESDSEQQMPQQLQQQSQSVKGPSTGSGNTVEGGVQTDPERRFECRYCGISFDLDVMYTIHMGCHGYDDPFKCNMCGEKSEDRIGFTLHLTRKAH